MSRLGEKGHKIVYVDPTNLLPAIRQSGWQIRRMEQINDDIIVVRPLFLPYHYRSSLIETVDGISTTRLIRKALGRWGSKEPDVLWVYSPYFNFMIDKWSRSSLIYDCVDACDGVFSNDRSSDRIRTWMLKREEVLCRKANAILAVSSGLLERCGQLDVNSYLISNGVSMLSAAGAVPEDLRTIKRPIIGYVGRLGDWFDYDLVYDLAMARPERSIVLIGPIDSKDDRAVRLSQASNIHILGTREYGQVASYIGGFDVCMIPFTVQPLTHMANPVKLFEYASLGKPIVSTPLDGVLEFSELVYASDGSSKGFIAMVDAALKEADADLRERRIAMAREHDWDAIADKVERILQEQCMKKAEEQEWAASNSRSPIYGPI